MSRSWVLQPAVQPVPAERQELIVPLLELLDGAGLEGFTRADTEGDAALRNPLTPVLRRLVDLGIVEGMAIAAPREPSVVLVTSRSKLASAEAVNELVEDEAWRTDHRTALGCATGPQRHLFVWLGDGHLEAWAGMERDITPAPPVLPMQVTSAWVARRTPEGHPMLADRVWQTNEAGEWEILAGFSRARTLSSVQAGHTAPGGAEDRFLAPL